MVEECLSLYTVEDIEGLKKIKRDKRAKNEVMQITVKEGLPCLQCSLFQQLPFVEHLFTTRLGGVSEGHLGSLNLSFARGDKPEAVTENYRRVAKALHCTLEDMVATKQTHTNHIRVVTKEDKGKGVTKSLDYDDIDGLVTNVPGIALSAFTADCVPIIFADPFKKVIGIVHSGWRGTVNGISKVLINKMIELYGCNPRDILAAIGPSVCQECYEVSEDVATQFQALLTGAEEELEVIEQSGIYVKNRSPIVKGKEAGKYQLDLWLCNCIILVQAGVLPQHIQITDVCTCHNPGILFSHRASQGKRGNMGAFIMLKKI